MKVEMVEIVGYIASVLVFSTFYMKTMIPLRIVGICSNVVFIAYGWLGELYPVVILHALLFPLNVVRLFQVKKLIANVREASQGDMSMDWLIPYSSRVSFKKGDILFRRGDIADSMYLIVDGKLRIEEIDTTLSEGQIVGEIGLFSPSKRRTATLICETDTVTLRASEEKLMELYFQNRAVGFYLTRLIIGRLLENQKQMSVNKNYSRLPAFSDN